MVGRRSHTRPDRVFGDCTSPVHVEFQLLNICESFAEMAEFQMCAVPVIGKAFVMSTASVVGGKLGNPRVENVSTSHELLFGGAMCFMLIDVEQAPAIDVGYF